MSNHTVRALKICKKSGVALLAFLLCSCALRSGGSEHIYSIREQGGDIFEVAPETSSDGNGDSQAAIPSPELEVNSEVQREINHLLGYEGRSIRQALQRRDSHLPLLLSIFQDEGVPKELISLAIVESWCNPNARSPMGALGMWQLMKGTARLYGLKVSGRVDQRKDIVLSSVAAARLLKDLYVRFGDWYLALAAYNAGPVTVARGLKRSGGDTFWELSRSKAFRMETKRFVPRFIAAAILADVWDRHGGQNLIENVRVRVAGLLDQQKARDIAMELKSSNGA